MKQLKTCLLLILTTLSVACKKDDNKNSALTGTWYLYGSYQSPGGPIMFTGASVTQTTEFFSNGTIVSNTFPGFEKYTVQDGSTLILKGTNVTEEHERYTIKGDTLSMSSEDHMCIEGCALVFIKEYKALSGH
jgi:hypothetical protein